MDNSDGYSSMFGRDHVIAEMLLRITALENLLISKNIILEHEIQEHLQVLSTKIASIIGTPMETLPTYQINIDDSSLDEEAETAALLKEFNLSSQKVSKDN